MDNLTHSLVGMLVGETADRVLPRSAHSGLSADQRRTSFLTLMVVGSNLPDLDFLYSTITGSKLDYLLHHRGHTHTVIGAVLIWLLTLLACEAWLRWRKLQPDRGDRLQLAGVALLAPLLHITLDSTNNYGVHPFWPFDNRWFYGDTIFIIEPLLWVATTPLLFTLRHAWARLLIGAVLAGGVLLSYFSGMVPPLAVLMLAAWTVVFALILRRLPSRAALISGIAFWLAVTATFALANRQAGAKIDALAQTQFPDARTLDHILTPLPVNPLCWQIILAQREGDDFVLRNVMLSLAPDVIRADACPRRGSEGTQTAALVPVQATSTAHVLWRDEISSSRSAVLQLVADDCRAAAFMRFARAPFLMQRKSATILGDLRYDRESELAFAEFEIDTQHACPAWVPPWTPPRDDLLRE